MRVGIRGRNELGIIHKLGKPVEIIFAVYISVLGGFLCDDDSVKQRRADRKNIGAVVCFCVQRVRIHKSLGTDRGIINVEHRTHGIYIKHRERLGERFAAAFYKAEIRRFYVPVDHRGAVERFDTLRQRLYSREHGHKLLLGLFRRRAVYALANFIKRFELGLGRPDINRVGRSSVGAYSVKNLKMRNKCREVAAAVLL